MGWSETRAAVDTPTRVQRLLGATPKELGAARAPAWDHVSYPSAFR